MTPYERKIVTDVLVQIEEAKRKNKTNNTPPSHYKSISDMKPNNNKGGP